MRPALNKIFHAALAAATATLLAAGSAAADTAYYSTSIQVPHRDVPVKLDIYYPAKSGGEVYRHGKNAVFTGIDLVSGAGPLPGLHPVVLFSHGSGGNGINTGWFAKALAETGMIVVIPNHPGSTSGDSDPVQSLKTWERPQDMSSLIDQMPDYLPEGLQADRSRIAAAGFSLGGYTALSLAGARISKQAFVDYCSGSGEKKLQECDWFTKDGYDLNAIDQEGFERDNSDPRISAVVSVDPGFAAAYDGESLAKVDRPVQVINLGSPGTIPAGVQGETIATRLLQGEYAGIGDAWHFSFLGECTGLGPYFLAITFDDPICNEPSGGDRARIHEEIAEETVSFLKRVFAAGNSAEVN